MREDHSEEEEMKYELEKETFQTESTLFCKRALATTKKMIVILNLLSRGEFLASFNFTVGSLICQQQV